MCIPRLRFWFYALTEPIDPNPSLSSMLSRIQTDGSYSSHNTLLRLFVTVHIGQLGSTSRDFSRPVYSTWLILGQFYWQLPFFLLWFSHDLFCTLQIWMLSSTLLSSLAMARKVEKACPTFLWWSYLSLTDPVFPGTSAMLTSVISIFWPVRGECWRKLRWRWRWGCSRNVHMFGVFTAVASSPMIQQTS